MARSASSLVIQEQETLSARLLKYLVPLVLIVVAAVAAYFFGISRGTDSQAGVPVPPEQVQSPVDLAKLAIEQQKVQALQSVQSSSGESRPRSDIQAEVQRLVMAFETERVGMQKEIDKLRADVLLQIEERDKLGETLKELDHQLLIDKTAYQELSTALENSSQEISRLRQEVDFYRNIVSPNENHKGLQVSGFRLVPKVEEGEWSLSLVLVHTVKQHTNINGELTIEIEGHQDGVLKIVDADALGADYDSKMRFKYYRRVRTQVSVPVGFEPSRVSVVFKLPGKNSPVLSEWYAWPSETAG